TFRNSEEPINMALERSREVKKLLVVYVLDVNTTHYILRNVDEERFPNLREICETEFLERNEQQGRKRIAQIAEKARHAGIEVKTIFEVGRFGIVCLDLARIIQPSVIVTTRSKRPEELKMLYGSPVDELMAQAECTVVPL
ncbi:MAG TPA: universal stress protein, partial [Thermodesulfobacteriota bacterium]|nr:universal stress protein [Thermodesulfobacteriota bacterium]